MTEVVIGFIGVLIGAGIGLGGAGIAALASVRASQLAARAPLAEKLHKLGVRGAELASALKSSSGVDEAHLALETTWSDIAAHQKILCPSARLARVLNLIWRAHQPGEGLQEDQMVRLASEASWRAADMIAAHSKHLLRWRATREEARILDHWIDDPDSLWSDHIKDNLRTMNHPFRAKLRRIFSRRPKLLP